MSRKKGFTAKISSGEDSERKLRHAVYGDAFSEETKSAFELAERLNDVAFDYHLDNSPDEKDCAYRPKNTKAYYRKQIAEAGEILINEVADAIEKNNASFFHALATAVETIAKRRANGGRHASPERAALLLWGQSNNLVYHPRKLKLRELQLIIEKRTGIKLDRRQVQRLCKELNIDKLKERGRPKKATINPQTVPLFREIT